MLLLQYKPCLCLICCFSKDPGLEVLKSAAGGGACGTILLEEDGPQSGTLVFLPFVGVVVKNCDGRDAAKTMKRSVGRGFDHVNQVVGASLLLGRAKK